MRAFPRLLRRGAALSAALLWLCGCARKAPTPPECERFALRVTGVSDRRMLAMPRVRAELDDWTRRCLTTPYDRELLACVERGEGGCYQRFAARNPQAADRDTPQVRP